MKTLAKLLAGLFVAILAVSNTFAIDAPVNVMSTSATQNSLTLNWDTVEWALYYNVYYSDTKGIDILTAETISYEPENSIEITDLEAGKDYYFILSSIDDQGAESVLTQEYSFSTLNVWTQDDVENQQTDEVDTQNQDMSSVADFQLSQIEVLYQNEVTVLFNAPLENTPDTEMIFSVTELEDETKEYTVSGSIVDPQNPNQAIVTFQENLPLDKDYKLVVISVFDQSGRNIESGIESYENFYMDPTTLVKQEESEITEPTDPVITQPVVTEPVDPVVTEPTDPVVNQEITPDPGAMNAADDKDSQEVTEPVQDVTGAATGAEVLPQTGPTHILMLLLALAFGGMAVAFRFKK